MKKIPIITAVILLITLLASVCEAKGRFPPKRLSARHVDMIGKIAPLIPPDQDVFELIAIAMIETNLREGLVSRGNYGRM